MKPRLLDLFCGAGGAAMGYHRAGFDIVGVDIRPQPFYPFPFVQADALAPPFDVRSFDAIHASPPCQGYSEVTRRYPDLQASLPKLIEPVRELLRSSGRPWIIENVVGALPAMRSPITICGRAMGLPSLRRHRLFESNMALLSPGCACRFASSGVTIGVYGKFDGRVLNSRSRRSRAARGITQAQEAMGMNWADARGTAEAIPPAYTEYLGWQLLAAVKAVA